MGEPPSLGAIQVIVTLTFVFEEVVGATGIVGVEADLIVTELE